MAWTISASAPGSINNTTSGTISLAVTTGDLIIVAVSMKDRTTWTEPTIADTVNTYTQIDSIKHQSAGADVDGCIMFRAIAASTTTLTITLTATSGIYARWGACKITGHNASSIVAASYDGEAIANLTSMTVTSGASNPSDALCLTMISSSANATFNLQSTGGSTVGTYTNLLRSSVGDYFPAWSFDYQQLGSPATQAVQYTYEGYNEGSSGLMVFINPAASGTTNDIEGEATLPAVGSITVSPTSMTMTDAGSETLTITVRDQYGALLDGAQVVITETVDSIVSPATPAVTNSSGVTTSLVSGVADGTTELSVSMGGVTSASVLVTVATTDVVTGVSIAPETWAMLVDETKQFVATVTGDGTYDDTVTWSLPSGAGSVSVSGLYTAPAAATGAVVRATSVGDTRFFAEATISVIDDTEPPPVDPGTVNVATTWLVSGSPFASQSLDYIVRNSANEVIASGTATTDGSGVLLTPVSLSYDGELVMVHVENVGADMDTTGKFHGVQVVTV